MSVGGEGGDGRGGGLINSQLRKLTSVGGEGGEGRGGGGSNDSQLGEVDICRWGRRGGGSINSQLREVDIFRWGGRGREGGRLTANSDRVCSQLGEDLHSVDPGGLIGSHYSYRDPQQTWRGST